MAKEKKVNTEVAAEKSKGNKLSVIIIVLLTIVIVGGGTFGVYILLNGKGKSTVASAKINVPKYAYEIEESTLNLADKNEKRYIKISLYLDYDNKKLGSELKDKDHIIKDSINSIVRSKTSNDLKGKGIDELKKQIVETVNSVLTKGKISDVSIYNILIQ